MEENLPPGFRFHPTDEELITYYLTRKVADFNFVARAITDVDLNKCEPWDLPGKASMGEKEWYFFGLKDRKYPTGLRTNRATDAGYWKTTGKDKEIFHGGVIVGMKKTLVFYKGRAPRGEKSNWVMHEYRLHTKLDYKPSKVEWVVCRVFHKSANGKKMPQSPSCIPQLLESSCDTTFLSDYGEVDTSNVSSLVNFSSGFNNVGTNNSCSNNNNNSSNSTNNNNIDMNMNWDFVSESINHPSLTWPSTLLNSNCSTNSSILRALHFNGNQSRHATGLNSFMSHGACFEANPNSNFSLPSSSKNADLVHQQQQQQNLFNFESVWKS